MCIKDLLLPSHLCGFYIQCSPVVTLLDIQLNIYPIAILVHPWPETPVNTYLQILSTVTSLVFKSYKYYPINKTTNIVHHTVYVKYLFYRWLVELNSAHLQTLFSNI